MAVFCCYDEYIACYHKYSRARMNRLLYGSTYVAYQVPELEIVPILNSTSILNKNTLFEHVSVMRRTSRMLRHAVGFAKNVKGSERGKPPHPANRKPLGRPCH
jgi:hypothetical protein